MRFPLKLLKKENFQLKLKLVEQKNHNVSFGWALKLCILFMVITWKSALACWGGYADYTEEDLAAYRKNRTYIPPVDEEQFINMTGITDPMERIIKSAWRGFEPDAATQQEWHKWYDDYHACKALYEGKKRKKKKGQKEQEPLECEKFGFPNGTGKPGGKAESEFSDDDRGPGSNWPNSPGWKGLGPGSAGVPVPPWAYVPKNTGKPSICYLAPVKGKCKRNWNRWGYNPYMDRCEMYIWSGCGGTRNRFTSKEKCENFCMQPPQPSCSVDSGIKETHAKRPVLD